MTYLAQRDDSSAHSIPQNTSFERGEKQKERERGMNLHDLLKMFLHSNVIAHKQTINDPQLSLRSSHSFQMLLKREGMKRTVGVKPGEKKEKKKEAKKSCTNLGRIENDREESEKDRARKGTRVS